MSPLHHPHHAARRIIGVVVLALLIGQWSLWRHTIDHSRALIGMVVVADDSQVWGHDAGSPVCKSLDHLLAGAPASGPSADVPCLPAGTTRLQLPATAVAHAPSAVAFEARGPPPV